MTTLSNAVALDADELLPQIDALISRIKSCDHLFDVAKSDDPEKPVTIYLDDFSGCIDCSNAALGCSKLTQTSLAARYAALLNGAMHVLTQMRQLQQDLAHRAPTR